MIFSSKPSVFQSRAVWSTLLLLDVMICLTWTEIGTYIDHVTRWCLRRTRRQWCVSCSCNCVGRNKPALLPDTTWYDVYTRHICVVCGWPPWSSCQNSEISCCLVAFLSGCYSRPRPIYYKLDEKTIDQRNHSLSYIFTIAPQRQNYTQHACSISSDTSFLWRAVTCDLVSYLCHQHIW